MEPYILLYDMKNTLFCVIFFRNVFIFKWKVFEHRDTCGLISHYFLEGILLCYFLFFLCQPDARLISFKSNLTR